MFSILGIEKNINIPGQNKPVNRIHVSQDLPEGRGTKPFPLSIINKGSVDGLNSGDPISLALDLDPNGNVSVSKVYTSEDVTFVVSGYEHVKSKEQQIFTKVYINQILPGDDGVIPLPITYFVAGKLDDFVPGSTCDLSFDIGKDNKLVISSLSFPTSEDIIIS